MKKANVRGKTIAILVSAMLALLMAGLLCLTPVRQTRARAAATVSDAAGLLMAYATAAEDGSGEITLGGDITLDLTVSSELTGYLPNGHLEMPKGVTIDLGEHTLTVKTGNASGTAQGVAPCCINIGQSVDGSTPTNATVTIKNGTLTGESYGSFAYVQSGSSLALKDVTVNFTHNTGADTDYSAALVSAGTVKMDGVTFGTLTNSYPMESSGTVTGGVQDLINASSASKPATITLTADLTQNLVVHAYASVTLDLGGHTITNVQKDNGYYDHAITNNGTLTIKGEGTVNATNSKNAIYNNTSATLTIENGAFSATGAQALFNKGTATIGGGDFDSSNGVQLITAFSGSLTITDGDFYNSNTFGGTAVGVTGGEVTISGGTFSAYNQAFSITGGETTISGSDYTVRSTAASAQIFSEGSNATVSGGTFNKAVSPEYLADGAAFGYNAKTGTFTVQTNATVFAHVDRNGQTYEFIQPQEAINFAEADETVVFDVSFRLKGSLVVNKSINLDLNGKTITNYDVNQAVIQVNSTTSDPITVKISSTPTGGSLVSEDGIAVWALRDANVTVEGLTLEGNVDAAYVGNSGENRTASLTLKDCNISAQYGVAAWGNTATGVTPTVDPVKLVLDGCTVNAEVFGVYGNGAQHNTEIELKNSNITATTGLGVYHPQNGTLTVDGGSITGVQSAIELRAGSLTIKGDAKLTATAEKFETNPNGSGTTVSGAALAISQHTTDYDINVNIESGTFKGVKAVYEADLQNTDSDNISLELTGGTFEGAVESQNVESFISGGTFSAAVSKDYLAEGRMQLQQSASGTYTVYESENAAVTAGAVAVVASTNAAYTDLQSAIDAAASGDTITLLKDIDVSTYKTYGGRNVGIYINKSLTINGNGHELNNTSSSVTRFVWVLNESATSTSADDNNDGNNIVVTFNNVNIVNNAVAAARAVETRSGDITLKFVGCTIDTSGSSGNTQGLTVGGKGADISVTFNKTTITPGKSGYSLITFNPADIEITNGSSFSGFASLYFKGIHGSLGSNGTTVAVKGSTLTSGGQEGGTNEFGTIVFEAGGITVDITDSTLSAATEATNTDQAIVMFSGYQDDTGASTVKITGTKIEADGNCVVFCKPNAVAENTALIGKGSTINIPVETKFLASGYSLLAGEDGYTAVEESTAISGGSAVAGIESNGTYILYATLQDAIDAAEAGETVKLVKDVETTAALAIESAITLDLNGFDITANGCRAIEVSAQGVTITSSQEGSVISTNNYRAINIGVTEQEDGAQPIEISNVTVRATSGSGTNTVGAIVVSGATVNIDKVTASGTAGTGGSSVQFAGAVVVLEYSNVTITDSNLTSTKGDGTNVEAHTIHSGSNTNSKGIVLTVKNSTITSDDTGVMFLGIYNNANAQNAVDADQGALPKLTLESTDVTASSFAVCGNGATHGTVIEIKGGTIKSEKAQAIYHPQYGHLTISGGATIEGVTGIEMRAGNLTIADAKVKVTATGNFSETANLSGSTIGGAAVAISQHTTNLPISVELSAGTYSATGENGKAVYEADLQDTDSDNIDLTIKGGTFNGAVESENVANFIEGGTFSAAVSKDYLAEGRMQLQQSASGTYTVYESENAAVTAGAVAVVASTNAAYTDLQSAIDAAKDGDTVMLLKDIGTESAPEAASQIVFYHIDGKVTLDLAGHNVYVTGSNLQYILVRAGQLTVKNSGESGGTISSSYAAFRIAPDAKEEAKLILEAGVKVHGDSGPAVIIIPQGDAIVSDTTATEYYAVLETSADLSTDSTYAAIQGNGNAHGTSITVNAGTLTSEFSAIYQPQYGKLVINDGTLTGGVSGMEIRAGVLEINGGTITANGEFDRKENGNGSTLYGVAVGVSEHTTAMPITVTINGGTFIATDDSGYAFYQADTEAETTADVNVTIEGGDFQAPVNSETLEQFISGGTFDELVNAKYLAEDVSLYTDEEGNYEVDKTAPEGMKAVGVVVNGVGYANVASALEAVEGNIEITLYTDLEEAVVIPEGRTVTLDLAGYTLTAPDESAVLTNNGTLTIKGGSIEGTTAVVNNGTLTIKGGTISGSTAITNSGYITSISGTTITATDGTAILLAGDSAVTNSGVIGELSNCTISGNIATTSAEAVGQLKITGGSLTGEANFATGSSLYFYNANGTIYVGLQDYVVTAGAVASIGTTAYGSLEAAIAAAATIDTITLIDDITVNSTIEIRTTKKLKFDLGEKTITGGDIENIFKITTTTVTFDDGTIDAQNTAFELIGSGLMASATVTFGDDLAITSQNDSAVYIYGGYKLNTTADITAKLAAIMGNGTSSGFTTINVNGGSLTSTGSVAMYLPQRFGTTTISGGTITGKTGIEIRNGTLNINGGTIVATGETLVTEPNGSGSTVNAGAAVAISKYTGTNMLKVTISDGELEGVYAIYEANLNPNEAEIDVTKITPSVKGGTFEGKVYSESLTGFVTGGRFDGAVDAEYLADGFVQTEANGLYTVVEGETVIEDGAAALNADTLIAYDSLQDAINEAGNGETITLLNDVEAAATIVVAEGKSVILELGEKTLSAADGVETTLSNEGTLTINGGTISGSTAIANSGYITSITDTVINAGSGTAILLAGDAETMNSGTIAELRGCTVAGDIATATAEAVGRLKLINTTFRGEMNFAEGSGLYYYTAADATYVGLQSYVVSACAVAAIGHEAYGGLQTAIDEADSDTVVLLTSIAVNETITVSEGFAVTLDLGGMTVTGGDVENVFLIDGVHFSAFNGSVTAENTAFKIVGNTGDFGRSITFGDTLYISSSNGTAVTVENSVILDTYASISAKLHAIAAAGETGSVQIKVNGGRLSSAEDAALYLGSSGSVTAVNAGTIVGKTGIELVSGTLNVTGGIIAAADETGYALYEAAEEGAETALSITGGTFEGKVYSESLTGFVTGGRFDELIEEAYLGEGVSIFSGERGYYIVDESAPEGMEAVRVIADGRTYESVAAALEATAGSVTITLYTDITEGVVIPEGRTVTLDLNGYTLTAPEGAAALTNSGTLTVEGGSIAGDITTAEGSVGQFKLVDITLNGEAVFAEDSGMYTYAAEDATYFGPRDYVVGVGAAASIGTAAYASLADAMEAAEDGATIVLIADLAAEETIAIDRDNVTIDLGGMTVTGGAEKLFLVSAVNVTFVNGTVEAEAIAFEIAGNASASEGAVAFGEGLFVTSEDTAVLVSGTGALIVTGGTITGNTAIEVRGGTLTVTGGTLTAEDAGYALYEAAEEGTAVAMAIEGGTVEGKVYSENLAGYITGGKFTVEPSEEACGEDCETRFEDGFYIVIDVAALNDAREAAQAEVMGYAEEKGMSWEYIVEIAAEESDSALKAEAQAVLAAYEAIAESEDEPAVGEAKTAALGAVDALIAAFDVLKDDAAAQIDGAASEAGITAPEALYTAVESAATEEALAESLAAALEEIAAIEEQIALIGTQEQQLEGIAGAMQALGEALNGTAEGSEALESVREAVQRAEAAVAGGTNGEMSAETLESEYDALAAAIDEALDALAVEAEGAGADADGLRDSLEALGADNAELDALITAAVSAAEDVQAADAAEVQAAAEELAAAVEALTAQLVVENGAVAAINGGMERAVEALTGGQFAGAAEALEAAVVGTENAVFTALAEDIAAAETAIGSAVGQLAGESGSLASFADAFQAIAESIASLGEDAGALEEAVEAVEASIAAAESAEGGLDRLSAAVEGAAGADAVVEAAQTIFEGWTAEGGRIGGLEARLTAAKQAVGELSEEAQETIGASVTAAETALAELRESITSLTGAEDAAAAAEGILQDIAALQTSIEDIESDVRAAEEDSGSNLTWLYIVIAVVAAAAVAAVVIVLVRRKKTQEAETISEAPEDDTKQNKD